MKEKEIIFDSNFKLWTIRLLYVCYVILGILAILYLCTRSELKIVYILFWFIIVKICERELKKKNPHLLAYIGAFLGMIIGILWWFSLWSDPALDNINGFGFLIYFLISLVIIICSPILFFRMLRYAIRLSIADRERVKK